MGGRNRKGPRCTVCREPAKGHLGPMGSRCPSLNDGYVVEEPVGSIDDTAGINRGDMVFDSDDRGGGEEDEFAGPGGLGGFAQPSSFEPQYRAADGGAFPSLDNVPESMASGLGAMGTDEVWQAAGSVPLHRQPSAHSGGDSDNYPRPCDPADNPWFRDPPLASSYVTDRHNDAEEVRPNQGPSG